MNRKVRVLHISPSIRGYGAERLVVELLSHLKAGDVEAALLTIYEPPAEIRAALPFPIFHAGRKNRKDRLFLWRLVREIQRFAPDIVHTHTHVGRYWGRIAAICAGVPRIVHTEHNPCDFRKKSPVESFADWILNRGTSRIVTFFNEQGSRLSRLERYPMQKMVMIPNGLEFPEPSDDRLAARARLAIRPDEFAILLVGRMEYQKNHILALRAFSALYRPTREKALLFFVGAGENEDMLRGLARALNIAERVRFLGYRTDVPSLLPAADLLLMTSWFEGMPLALLEAMTAGIPVVTTPWLGANDMLENGRYGFLAPDFEPFNVAAQIERAIARPTIRRNVAERAKHYVRAEYGVDRMVDAHRQLYLELSGKAS
ncbi:MAG TPA: glycosyltransferase [Candidatus Cybelea sp.]|jgi:glycosyltransferase involved in cell wall biosynthesis|nr:glycosyltransferase [Candidatus Cybelea sp.]